MGHEPPLYQCQELCPGLSTSFRCSSGCPSVFFFYFLFFKKPCLRGLPPRWRGCPRSHRFSPSFLFVSALRHVAVSQFLSVSLDPGFRVFFSFFKWGGDPSGRLLLFYHFCVDATPKYLGASPSIYPPVSSPCKKFLIYPFPDNFQPVLRRRCFALLSRQTLFS